MITMAILTAFAVGASSGCDAAAIAITVWEPKPPRVIAKSMTLGNMRADDRARSRCHARPVIPWPHGCCNSDASPARFFT
jgi:hypothetical protein